VLLNLEIENIVLIDKSKIAFGPNFCALTGETGSGKSILLDALGLAIGFRSNVRLIGNLDRKSKVAAEFDISSNQNCLELLKENDLLDSENSNLLRIRRSTSVNDKENISNKIFVNDNLIGVNLLNQIGETLVEIHGQHDQRGLLNKKYHQQFLDEFAKNHEILNNLQKTYDELKLVSKKVKNIKDKKEENEREKDYLEHVITEITKLELEENEEEKLIKQKDQLKGKEKILEFIKNLKNSLIEANSHLISSQKTIIRNQNIIDNYLEEESEIYEKLSTKIDQQNIELEEEISKIEDKISEITNSNNSLEEVEERLLEIRSLARKLHVSPQELTNILEDLQEKLQSIKNDEGNLVEFEKKQQELTSKYQDLASKLSNNRKEQAKILSAKVESELKSLKMADVKFLVDIKSDNSVISPSGIDQICFLAAINNNNFGDIAKIASGGELSRFMLALKVALINIKSVPTIIFDEIDTGIGGNTADAVGKRLKILSKNLQILVVTHQAQIAAKADSHYRIDKVAEKNGKKTIIEELNKEKSEMEIARMISGEKITKEAIATAKKLITHS